MDTSRRAHSLLQIAFGALVEMTIRRDLAKY